MRTTRPLEQGEELLVDYGDEYWRQLHKNKRRRAVREANQYSDADTEESSEEALPRRPSTRSSDDSAMTRQWLVVLDEIQPRGNRAIDWLVKEELPEVLATGRRRFSVPAALLDEADVFARLNWQRFDKNSWKIPEELEVQMLVRTYDEHQKTQLRARAARAATLYASGSAQQRKKPSPTQPVGDEGASMLTGYPELLGLLQLRELKESGTISQEEFAQYKTYLQRAFVGRFN